MDDQLTWIPEPYATVYVFGVRRPQDSAPWYLAFMNQAQAEGYPHRCTGVTAVSLYGRQSADSAGEGRGGG